VCSSASHPSGLGSVVRARGLHTQARAPMAECLHAAASCDSSSHGIECLHVLQLLSCSPLRTSKHAPVVFSVSEGYPARRPRSPRSGGLPAARASKLSTHVRCHLQRVAVGMGQCSHAFSATCTAALVGIRQAGCRPNVSWSAQGGAGQCSASCALPRGVLVHKHRKSYILCHKMLSVLRRETGLVYAVVVFELLM
jgi:hypothetical protein